MSDKNVRAASSTAEPMVRIEGLRKSFGSLEVLRDINLDVMPGQVVTIIGALLLGCSRVAAAEFSFYLSIPVMVGASLLKLVTFFIDSGAPDLNEVVFLIVGMVVSFAISLFAVKWLMGFVKKHSFSGFGYYRIALGLLVIVFFSTMFGLGKMPLI